MPSTKNSQVPTQRRISQTGAGNNLRGPEPVTSASSKTPSSVPTTGGAAACPSSSSSSSSPSTSLTSTTTMPPITMTPISQILNGPRRTSRLGPGGYRSDDNPAAWDPEHYNPDGSLRTVHKMPAFEQTYAQAMNARYIRHSKTLDREKELSVKQIFDKS